MRISEAAAQLGVSPSWLRKLEREGTVPPARRDGHGNRRYNAQDVAHLRSVIYAARVELAEVMLRLGHTVNGVRYGPGRALVLRELVGSLLATEEQAARSGR